MPDGMADGCADLGGCLVAPFEVVESFSKDPKGCLLSSLQLFVVLLLAGVGSVWLEPFFASFSVSETVFMGLLGFVAVLGLGSFLAVVLLQQIEEKTPRQTSLLGLFSVLLLVCLLTAGMTYLQYQLVVVDGRAHLVKAPSEPDVESRVTLSQVPSTWKAALRRPHLRAWLLKRYPKKTRSQILGFGSDWWRKMLDKRRTRRWLMKHFPERAKKELALWKKESPLKHKLKKLKKAAARVMGDAAKGAARSLWQRVRKVWRRRPPPGR